MEVISSIGSLIFFFSLVYLVYHLIRKRKNPVRTLPKKKFYTALIGGFSLFFISSSLMDTSVQDALDEALETNAVLVAENKEHKSTYEKLKANNDKASKELKDQQQAHKEETESYEKQIADLKAKTTALTTEVDNLKKQVASKESNSTASSSGASSSSSVPAKTTVSAPVTSSGSEWFQNCTEMRKKYPSGVAQGHAAYASKHDRDKDGWACE